MASDHEYRQKLFDGVVSEVGLDKDERNQFHSSLGNDYWDTKDAMNRTTLIELPSVTEWLQQLCPKV
jgi:hypothetical protein